MLTTELELEARERQIRLAGTRPNSKPQGDLPQKSGEGKNPDDLETDLQVSATSLYDANFGYHRLEAAKALGWEQIDARVLELDDLEAELLEIDENLRRYDLTAWEQSQHIERREALLKKKGERAIRSGNGSNQHGSKSATVTHLHKTTPELAAEAGMSKRTYKRRSAVGRDIAPATADILNAIVDLATCDLPDSPKQLEYLAKLEPTALSSPATI